MSLPESTPWKRAEKGVICPNCSSPIEEGSSRCPNCQAVILLATDRGVVAGRDINAPVITGDIHAPVTIQFSALPDIPPPPQPDRPPILPDFVGREAEKAYFAQKLQQVHLAVIAGMAGVGKTALAAELARQMAPPEMIFWHTFHEEEGVDALVWHLAAFLAWHQQDDLWRMLNRARADSARMMARELIFNYLLEMVRGRGYLLCLDDFHFVDDDPLIHHFIDELRAALLSGEVSLVITSRRTPDFLTLTEFDQLQGLTLEDTRRLIGARGMELPEELSQKLHHHTGGNAQLLILAVQALSASRDLVRSVENLIDARDIERYLLQEVDAGLSDREREVMSASAVLLGYPGTRAALEFLLDTGLRRILASLAESHLLIASEGPVDLEYRQHAMLQAFYYDLLSRSERQNLHRRAGEFYTLEEPDSLKAGLHYERAGEAELAVRSVTPDLFSIINTGQARAALHMLERLSQADLPGPAAVQAFLALGRLYAFVGEPERARQSLNSALERLDSLPDQPPVSELRAQACFGMAEFLEFEDPQEAIEWLRRGAAYASQEDGAGISRASLVAAFSIKTGSLYFHLGKYPEAREALERGLALLPPGPGRLRALTLRDLGAIAFSEGEIDQAVRLTSEALEISQALSDTFGMANILMNLGIYRFTSDDWQAGIASFTEALQLARQLGSRKQQASLETNLGAAYINLGEDSVAEARLRAGLALAGKSNLEMIRTLALLGLGDLFTRRGELEKAEPFLQQAEETALEMDLQSVLMDIYRLQAEHALAAGRVEDALSLALQAVALGRELGEEASLGPALRVLGQILAADGETQAALAAFEESDRFLAEQDHYEGARTGVEWGLALQVAGQPEQAQEKFAAAQKVFQRFGARRDLERVEKIINP